MPNSAALFVVSLPEATIRTSDSKVSPINYAGNNHPGYKAMSEFFPATLVNSHTGIVFLVLAAALTFLNVLCVEVSI